MTLIQIPRLRLYEQAGKCKYRYRELRIEFPIPKRIRLGGH
jgi:hypothetical protein